MLWGHKKAWDFSLHWNCTSQWQGRHVRWTSVSFALLTRILMFSPNRAILHQINVSRATEIKPSPQVVLQDGSLLHRAPKISSHSILSSAGPNCPQCYTKSDLLFPSESLASGKVNHLHSLMRAPERCLRISWYWSLADAGSRLLYTSSKMWPFASNIVNHPYHFDQDEPKHAKSLRPVTLSAFPRGDHPSFQVLQEHIKSFQTSFAIQLNKWPFLSTEQNKVLGTIEGSAPHRLSCSNYHHSLGERGSRGAPQLGQPSHLRPGSSPIVLTRSHATKSSQSRIEHLIPISSWPSELQYMPVTAKWRIPFSSSSS